MLFMLLGTDIPVSTKVLLKLVILSAQIRVLSRLSGPLVVLVLLFALGSTLRIMIVISISLLFIQRISHPGLFPLHLYKYFILLFLSLLKLLLHQLRLFSLLSQSRATVEFQGGYSNTTLNYTPTRSVAAANDVMTPEETSQCSA